MSRDVLSDAELIAQAVDRVADALEVLAADAHDPARIRFFPPAARDDLVPFAVCAECGSLIANDAEGANRSQHTEWHAVTLTKRGPR